MTYVCITGNEHSQLSLEQRLERVLASHPRVLCELRLDYLDLGPAAAFSFLARLPGEWAPRLVLTQRLKASGPQANGLCSWDVLTWQSWWRDVMALRPWFAVDLDWLVLDRLAGESLAWRGKFRSRHAFFSLHSSLAEAQQLLPNLVASAREHSAGVKLACPVETSEDLISLAGLAKQLDDLPLRTVVAMGNAGKGWRWSGLAGSLTYFSVDAGRATAPGQEEMASVLPYLATKQRPDLYVLLGDNPENRYGEMEWNRAFLRRGARARYVNIALKDSPGTEFSGRILPWLEAAQVRGASVTKPYKLSFSPGPVNTLKRAGKNWEMANTDGSAVSLLLRRHGVLPGESVVIAGGGGAARAGLEGLESAGYKPYLWIREGGKLGPRPEGAALVSTWPGEVQEPLVEALALHGAGQIRLVIDAQFSREPSESPLARWAAAHGFSYVSGKAWWREQARQQDRIWFGPDRLGQAREASLRLVPASKSETLRALAISAAFGVPAEIHGPALNDDTEVFVRAIEALGVSVDRDGNTWRIFPPPEGLKAPNEPIDMREGATGFRILGAMSCLISGTLRLTGAPRLQERPHQELKDALGLHGNAWPIEIECGTRPLVGSTSLERSSQFATGFLIAGAAEIYRGRREIYELKFEGGEARSLSYLKLTLEMLEEAGIGYEKGERSVKLFLKDKKKRFLFPIEKDASSLAFFEVYARRWGLLTFFEGMKKQGDSIFPDLLDQLLSGETEVSLAHHPDLAPPLWAAAALFRKRLVIKDCPQLHLKESDRAALLVEAAVALGASGTVLEDGFEVDFSGRVAASSEVFIRTDGDHRMAMAAGILSMDDSFVGPDRRDCVRKSFPGFWQALGLLEEAQPG